MAVGKKTNKAGLGRQWFRLRSFAACVRKDICLFSSAAGIACLLLPFIAACLLAFGLNDALAAENVIEPFPVAVIDRDETVMSRMLIGQLRRIELFSEIRCVSGSKFDSAFRTAEDAAPIVDFEEDMLAGCAAAVTIPKDYFYSGYYMDEGKVDAWLNGEMPLESELTADIIESVAEIMAGERAAMLAAFRIAEGDEPSAEAVQRFRDACANAVLDSAMGRRAVFKDSPGAFGVRSAEVLFEKYFVCAVCMLFFSVSLGIMKTVPDELQMGTAKRFICSGGSRTAFSASKFAAAAAICTVGAVPLVLVFKTPFSARLLLTLLLGSTVCAELMFLLSLAFKRTERFMLAGGIVMLAALFAGGVIYPLNLMPEAVQKLSILSVARHMFAGIVPEAAGGGSGLGPLAAAAGILALLCGAAAAALGGSAARRHGSAKGGSMMILRLALQKIRAMVGGYGFFAAVLAAAFALFFIVAATLGTTRTQLLRIALTDEDDSPLSHEFAELLNDSDGEITGGKTRFVSVRFGTREESEEAVRSGKAEGALIILKGFGAGLESGEEAFLEYRASADASSAQAAEEIIGGRAVALRSRLRSADYAKKLLNRGLTEKELSELEVAAKEYYNEQVGAVRFERIGGSVEKADSSVFGALRARFSGIGAFAVLTLLLTLGSWTGSNAAQAAEKRLAAEKGGVSISFWSNFLALFICGIAMYAVMYIAAAAAGRNSPNGHELLAAGCYLFCASALALVVGGADISGRMNLAAPFIAFATSLLGGCFADTAARGGLFAKLALLTPQGLCIAGTDGSVACLAVLAGAGVVLLALKRAALRVKFAERR